MRKTNPSERFTAGIVRNHPFVDGNKRTGFVVGVLFLEMNGHRFIATEETAAQAVLSLAAGTLDEPAFHDTDSVSETWLVAEDARGRHGFSFLPSKPEQQTIAPWFRRTKLGYKRNDHLSFLNWNEGHAFRL
jgi:hypothetical protein